jgi:hypothetical protein
LCTNEAERVHVPHIWSVSPDCTALMGCVCENLALHESSWSFELGACGIIAAVPTPFGPLCTRPCTLHGWQACVHTPAAAAQPWRCPNGEKHVNRGQTMHEMIFDSFPTLASSEAVTHNVVWLTRNCHGGACRDAHPTAAPVWHRSNTNWTKHGHTLVPTVMTFAALAGLSVGRHSSRV